MGTLRLYHKDTEARQCDATVLDCRKTDDGFEVLLDRTVIFPEGGGQPSDTGHIDDAPVTYAREDGEYIWHRVPREFAPGQRVDVGIDWERRFDHCQQHTGEHILSGVAKRLFNAVNVGFHVAEDYATVDFDIFLDAEKLAELELHANRAVHANIPVTYRFVSPEEAETLELRKRAEGLTGEIRIVYIGDVDSCTCCATHCKASGQVGLIKIISSMKYKGGTRLFFACGMRAFKHYQVRQAITDALARRFSVKPGDVLNAVEKLSQDYSAARLELKQRTGELIEYIAAEKLAKAEAAGSARLVMYTSDTFTSNELKLLADVLCRTRNTMAVLFAKREDSISYCLACSEGIDYSMKEACLAVNAALGGKGGGREQFALGSAPARQGLEEAIEQLKRYFLAVLHA